MRDPTVRTQPHRKTFIGEKLYQLYSVLHFPFQSRLADMLIHPLGSILLHFFSSRSKSPSQFIRTLGYLQKPSWTWAKLALSCHQQPHQVVFISIRLTRHSPRVLTGEHRGQLEVISASFFSAVTHFLTAAGNATTLRGYLMRNGEAGALNTIAVVTVLSSRFFVKLFSPE